MAEYLVPQGLGESEVVEKRSRFLGALRPVSSEAEARAYIESIKKRHYDARHNCWCYRIHGGPERYSDDGEPQGTAGVPMLSLLQKAGVENVVCVVTRYFGGVLLGAGGLVRAYTQAAQGALEKAGVGVVCLWNLVSLSCPYPLLEQIKLLAAQRRGVVEDIAYGQDVTLQLSFPQEETEGFGRAVTELSAGSLVLQPLGTVCRAAPLER